MTRIDLLLELAGTGGRVAEVGVHVGDFAVQLLHHLEPAELILIDAWRFLPGEYERDPMNRRERPFAEFHQKVVRRFDGRADVRIIRETSASAAFLFAPGELDVVYLDADHTRPGITGDLARWWPKIRSGGVLAGHDYHVKRKWIDVGPVVDEWALQEGLEVRSSTDALPSWAVVKP